jgi:hypothetical protein
MARKAKNVKKATTEQAEKVTPLKTDPIESVEAEKNNPLRKDSPRAAEIEIDPTAAASKIVPLPLKVGNPTSAASLAIDQEHLEELADPESRSSVIECKRPGKGQFFTVRPESGKKWKDRALFYVLEIEGRDPYIVSKEVADKKKVEEDTIRPVMLVRYVTMTGEEGLWPVKLNPADGKANAWNTSALNILKIAEEGWVRIISGKKQFNYSKSSKTLEDTPPRFSDRSFGDLFSSAFPEDRIVTTLDHEIWTILKQGSTK